MHAIEITETGGPEVLRYVETAQPTPGRGELLIKAEAIGVNFIDTYFREGKYPRQLPFVIGSEVCGTVAAIGEGVDGFSVGDRVVSAAANGGYAEFATAPAFLSARVPDGVTSEVAASVLLGEAITPAQAVGGALVLLGLALAVMCGIFSSGMSFAMDAAQPLKQAAEDVGVKHLYSALPAYVFIMGGGALVNFAYCFGRLVLVKTISLKADLRQPQGTVLRNAALAATGGIMWYFQFFFYAWGQANIPDRLSYVNWMLHMSGYVLFGGIVGVALGEWADVSSRSIRLLWVGIAVIILAANLVGLGLAT